MPRNKQCRGNNSLGLVSPCGFDQFAVERGIKIKLSYLVQFPLAQMEVDSGMFTCVGEIASACKSSALAGQPCSAAIVQQYCTPGPNVEH